MSEPSQDNQPDAKPISWSGRIGWWIVIPTAVVATLALVGVNLAVGHATTGSRRGATSAPSPTAPTTKPTSGCASRTTPQISMSSPDATLGMLIGRQAGTALAGDAPLVVSAAQVRQLGDQTPSGASVDACADRTTFTATTVTLVVEAVPPNNPDMTFRIAGLVNPTVVVPKGAQVDLEFINADSDEAHAFVITPEQPPFAFHPAAEPAFPGSAAGPVGDPTAAGQGARNVEFTASISGSYQYLCPMPGHAEMGMHGAFIVQ
jgi:rusticyanin